MTDYFISATMDGIRMRVSFKDVVDFRKRTIKMYAETRKKDWEVFLFDYYQNYLGNLYSDGDEVRWIASGSFKSKRITKEGKIYKTDR